MISLGTNKNVKISNINELVQAKIKLNRQRNKMLGEVRREVKEVQI